MSPNNKAHFQAEKEAIFLLLTGIGDEIYSIVDTCQIANEIWIAIERLQQGESLNIQDVKTNLFWEFEKFTSRDGESMESYYSYFYKMMNEMIRNNFQVATMQYQKEVNEIHAKRIAKSANPLALVTAAQPYPYPNNYYQAPKPQRSYAPAPKHASTRHKGKEIAKVVTPLSESGSDEDSDPEQAQKDKEMQKNLALIAKYFKKLYKPTNNNLRTSSNFRHKTVDTFPRYKNDNQSRQFGNQRTVSVAGARETESNATRDSYLIALQTKQTELEKYIAFNDRTIDYDKLQTKLSETLGQLAQKDIDIKEGLKLKAYEISVVKQKHYELVKQSLLTKSHFEGLLKEKSKVISDLKVKEGKDIDKMISMEKQLKFLNEIVYKQNQSIQTIHMLAPKCSTYNGRSTFANPVYLRKDQAEKPCLYEIMYDNFDLANRFIPD
ncbi:hypothetical protein Tco_1211618 [Tanacetum coccineum]